LLLTVYCLFIKKNRRGQGGACVRRRGAPVPRHNGTMASPSLGLTKDRRVYFMLEQLCIRPWNDWHRLITTSWSKASYWRRLCSYCTVHLIGWQRYDQVATARLIGCVVFDLHKPRLCPGLRHVLIFTGETADTMKTFRQ